MADARGILHLLSIFIYRAAASGTFIEIILEPAIAGIIVRVVLFVSGGMVAGWLKPFHRIAVIFYRIAANRAFIPLALKAAPT